MATQVQKFSYAKMQESRQHLFLSIDRFGQKAHGPFHAEQPRFIAPNTSVVPTLPTASDHVHVHVLDGNVEHVLVGIVVIVVVIVYKWNLDLEHGI